MIDSPAGALLAGHPWEVYLMAAVDIVISGHPSAVEWPDIAWVDEMISAGVWRPVPFDDFVLKTHSRCNLSCDYCYLYEMGDDTWRARPGVMSREVLARAAGRIADHVVTHRLGHIRVIFHGGEPLLAGRDFFDHAARTVRAAVPSETTVGMSVITNGVVLDEEFLRVLVAHDIDVCVSIDGDRAANDRHRRYANGNSSYDKVVRALRLVGEERYRKSFVGVIGVIDLANDPVSTYEALLEFAPPSIDFLLPYGNWSNRPSGRDADPAHTPYADWLITVFERWYSGSSGNRRPYSAQRHQPGARWPKPLRWDRAEPVRADRDRDRWHARAGPLAAHFLPRCHGHGLRRLPARPRRGAAPSGHGGTAGRYRRAVRHLPAALDSGHLRRGGTTYSVTASAAGTATRRCTAPTCSN